MLQSKHTGIYDGKQLLELQHSPAFYGSISRNIANGRSRDQGRRHHPYTWQGGTELHQQPCCQTLQSMITKCCPDASGSCSTAWQASTRPPNSTQGKLLGRPAWSGTYCQLLASDSKVPNRNVFQVRWHKTIQMLHHGAGAHALRRFCGPAGASGSILPSRRFCMISCKTHHVFLSAPS